MRYTEALIFPTAIVFRRIFGFNKWESVRCFIHGLGRLDFCHQKLLLHLKFCRLNLSSSNATMAHVMKLYYGSHIFVKLCASAGLSEYEYANLKTTPVGKIRASVYRTFALT